MEFNSLQELYDRIKPALITKKHEMIRLGYTYVNEVDIWNYLKETKWIKSHELSLYEMVGDILNTSNEEIDAYLKQILKIQKREINLEGEI